jgi:hypothetical protein
MAGILNNKERIIDFIITSEGKRQATAGQMKIEFATFTDLHTFYTPSGSSGGEDPVGKPGVAEDASDRIYFEATDRYQDVIVPELEAGSSMRPFRTSDFVFSGKVVASGTVKTGFAQRVNILTGSKIRNVSGRSIEGITNNFADLRILGTHDEFSDTTGFELSTTTGSFAVSNGTKFGRTLTGLAVLEDIPSLFGDRRFAHLPNFKYLPPVNVPSPGSPTGTPLGVYPNLDEPDILTLEDLELSLADKPMLRVEFTDTSRDNNLIGQLFEYSSVGIEKLSIVDFGEFGDDDPFSPGKRVFFLGKIRKDNNGTETFMNIFTMVFD